MTHPDGATPEQLWRNLCATEYRVYLVGYGNDGDPRNDLSPARHHERAADLADRLSRQVSIPSQELRGRASEAAYLHGQDPGTDYDPDRFAPPVWSQLANDSACEEGRAR
jgi:hypothetical protein